MKFLLLTFCRFMAWLQGWKLEGSIPADINKGVIAAVPHTSNWDFIFALVMFEKLGISPKFTIKKEQVRFPFKNMMLNLGALPIDRQAKHGQKADYVDQMVSYFKQSDRMFVVVTPEATRSANAHWKSGFYRVARAANVPILVGYVDYKRKVGGIKAIHYPTDNIVDALQAIKDATLDVTPKYPAKFLFDARLK